MNPDNTRLGLFCSFALHICVALAIVLSMFWSAIFPPPQEPEMLPFDMVEPPSPEPPQQELPAPSPQIDAPEVKDIKPLELPPEPEMSEPEPEPEPTPKPIEKKDEPKPENKLKPVEKPKTVSYKDFIKNNPDKKTPQKVRPSKGKPIVAPKISANVSNIENIANISTTMQTSGAMKNALAAYIAYIREKALRNWAVTGGGLEARIGFRVSKNGEISGVKILESSGDSDFDNAAVKAFSSLTQLDPPPDNNAHTVTIRFKSNN